MKRHLALAVALIGFFFLADHVREHGLHGLGAAIDVMKLLVAAALLVGAWRAGLRVIAVVGLLLFSVTACAPLEWARPDATPEQVRADATDCQQRAAQEAQWRSFAAPHLAPAWRQPYRRGPLWRDPFWDDTFLDETRLARFCMESRGYRLQATESR